MNKKRSQISKKQLTEIGELGLIKSFRSKCSLTSPDIIEGIGDDAAAVNIRTGSTLITSDMMLEKVHFDISLTTFFQLGHKLLAVNISDIFAMGGIPRYFLLNLGLPGDFRIRDINELYSGLMGIARKYGVSIIGGDTCASKHGLVMSGTLVGVTSQIINRSGARPGDGIFVSDALGDSAMGLMLIKKLGSGTLKKLQKTNSKLQIANTRKMVNRVIKIRGKTFALQDVLYLIQRHLMPEPRPVKKTTGITSMIDVSDGLLMDLSHICNESGVGAVIYDDKIPLSDELKNAAIKLGVEPRNLALYGGEDYVLLFTAPLKSNIKDVVRIGEITKKGRYILNANGKKTRFRAEGYEHFR
jgi:thiamine-monophosphate kinase